MQTDTPHSYQTLGGYIMLCFGKQKIFEHRYVLQQHLGRKLEQAEIAHHKNMDKADNRIENLQICSLAEHMKIHRKYFASDTHKECSMCRNILPRSQFYKNYFTKYRKNADDHDMYCKKCSHKRRYKMKKAQLLRSGHIPRGAAFPILKECSVCKKIMKRCEFYKARKQSLTRESHRSACKRCCLDQNAASKRERNHN